MSFSTEYILVLIVDTGVLGSDISYRFSSVLSSVKLELDIQKKEKINSIHTLLSNWLNVALIKMLHLSQTKT